MISPLQLSLHFLNGTLNLSATVLLKSYVRPPKLNFMNFYSLVDLFTILYSFIMKLFPGLATNIYSSLSIILVGIIKILFTFVRLPSL
jgi:hypothetical protein